MLSDKEAPHILGYSMNPARAALKARILDKEGIRPWSGHGTDDKIEQGWYKVVEHEPKLSSWSLIPANLGRCFHAISAR